MGVGWGRFWGARGFVRTVLDLLARTFEVVVVEEQEDERGADVAERLRNPAGELVVIELQPLQVREVRAETRRDRAGQFVRE